MYGKDEQNALTLQDYAANDIIDVIKESVDVIEILKPIYNFKASE